MSKKENDFEVEVDDLKEETKIDSKNDSKNKKKTTKKLTNTVESLQSKIFLLFSLFSHILGKENMYDSEHFKVEAECLLEMSLKYEIVAFVIEMFNPIVFVASLVQKFTNLKNKNKKQQEAKKVDETQAT